MDEMKSMEYEVNNNDMSNAEIPVHSDNEQPVEVSEASDSAGGTVLLAMAVLGVVGVGYLAGKGIGAAYKYMKRKRCEKNAAQDQVVESTATEIAPEDISEDSEDVM